MRLLDAMLARQHLEVMVELTLDGFLRLRAVGGCLREIHEHQLTTALLRYSRLS